MMKGMNKTQHKIAYQGETLMFETEGSEPLPNDWTKFRLKSSDKQFIRVFGKEQITLSLDLQTAYSPEGDIDYNERSPEQTILVREIWEEIRKHTQPV